MIWLIIGIVVGVIGVGIGIGCACKFRREAKQVAEAKNAAVKRQQTLEDVCGQLTSANAQLEQEKQQLELQKMDLEFQKQDLAEQAQQLKVDNSALTTTVDALENTVELLNTSNDELQGHLRDSLANNAFAQKTKDDQKQKVESDVVASEKKLQVLNGQVESRTAELNEVAAQFKELMGKLNEAQAQKTAAAKQLEQYKVELQDVLKELEDARTTHRGVLLGDENWSDKLDFELAAKESKLIVTLGEISELYPELTKDLAGIEWKKVWLPKIQDWEGMYKLNVRGIYRLVLKSDENISYVGQATNIGSRWREHIKKMVGADSKGSEKLYQYRPEDFYWTVVERNSENLNQAEHYWIDYYCCKERGLNKKK